MSGIYQGVSRRLTQEKPFPAAGKQGSPPPPASLETEIGLSEGAFWAPFLLLFWSVPGPSNFFSLPPLPFGFQGMEAVLARLGDCGKTPQTCFLGEGEGERDGVRGK